MLFLTHALLICCQFNRYLVQAHSFCLNLPEFPLNLEICIEHLSHGRLKIELRPNFHTWGNRRYRVSVSCARVPFFVACHRPR